MTMNEYIALLEQANADVEKWRNAYSALMHAVYLITDPVDAGSELAVAQIHTRDQLHAIAAEWLSTFGDGQ